MDHRESATGRRGGVGSVGADNIGMPGKIWITAECGGCWVGPAEWPATPPGSDAAGSGNRLPAMELAPRTASGNQHHNDDPLAWYAARSA